MHHQQKLGEAVGEGKADDTSGTSLQCDMAEKEQQIWSPSSPAVNFAAHLALPSPSQFVILSWYCFLYYSVILWPGTMGNIFRSTHVPFQNSSHGVSGACAVPGALWDLQ